MVYERIFNRFICKRSSNLQNRNCIIQISISVFCKVVLRHYEHEFMELAVQCPAVVVCRCTPTQKAEIVRLLKTHTGKRTCSIGDGGNDVSMIQMADAGVGIEGKVIEYFPIRFRL